MFTWPFKIILAALVSALLAAATLIGWYYWKSIYRTEVVAIQEVTEIEKQALPIPDPGKNEYAQAVELIRKGEVDAGREKLALVMRYYRESSRYSEAKRLLGEMNMDVFLSREPSPYKINYVVQRGDALISIAKKNHTTVSLIMRLNQLTSTRLQPGDRLLLVPSDFTVEIALQAKTLTLKRDGAFFKEYPIRKVVMPRNISLPIETKISEKIAWRGQRHIRFTAVEFHDAEKWIMLGRGGVLLRPWDAEFEKKDGLATGIMMEYPDIEELFTILDVGTAVRIAEELQGD